MSRRSMLGVLVLVGGIAAGVWGAYNLFWVIGDCSSSGVPQFCPRGTWKYALGFGGGIASLTFGPILIARGGGIGNILPGGGPFSHMGKSVTPTPGQLSSLQGSGEDLSDSLEAAGVPKNQAERAEEVLRSIGLMNFDPGKVQIVSAAGAGGVDADSPDIVQALERLAALRDQRSITAAEFEAAKARLLGR